MTSRLEQVLAFPECVLAVSVAEQNHTHQAASMIKLFWKRRCNQISTQIFILNSNSYQVIANKIIISHILSCISHLANRAAARRKAFSWYEVWNNVVLDMQIYIIFCNQTIKRACFLYDRGMPVLFYYTKAPKGLPSGQWSLFFYGYVLAE